MGVPSVLFLLSASVAFDGAALRPTCDPYDTALAELKAGDAVEIRHAMTGDAGPCYKVAVTTGGRTVEGWLPAKAVRGSESFERARNEGAALVTVTASEPPKRRAAGDAVPLPEGADERLRKAAGLLNSHRPAEALSILEAMLKQTPRDPNLLAVAGVAAYQSDQVRLAVDYWEQSMEIAPAPSVERLLRDARREVEADQSSEKLFGMRFLFRYDVREIGPEQARSIVPALDQEFARLSETLGCNTDERIAVVVQSPEAFRKATGAAEWAAGRSDGRSRVARIAGNRIGEDTRRTVAHEIVHACLARIGDHPAWLHEGLAQKLSGEPFSETDRSNLRQMARSGQLPSLAKLGHTFSRLSAHHARIAYAAALAAVELLYEAYGIDGVRNLLRNPEMLPQITADLDRRLRQ